LNRVRILAATSALTLSLAIAPASAQQVNATSTTVVEWRTDNDDDPDDTENYDDSYGTIVEHLDVSGTFGDFLAGVRLDLATFLSTPNADDPLPGELVDRYETFVNVEKVRARWAQRDFTLQAGDAYVSFGRGLALSMRKIDEFGTDNTVRGARALLHRRTVSGSVVVGYANINNLDEASGREAAYPFEYGEPLDLPYDRIAGAQLGVRLLDKVTLGGHGVEYAFYDPLGFVAPGAEWENDRWYAFGPTVDAMGITDHFGFYLEAVGQHRNAGTDIEEGAAEVEAASGYGVYGSATYHRDRATLLVEAKAYGDLLVVQPSADLPIEFEAVQYYSPPTIERITQILDHPQQDTVGGRARFDWRANDNFLIFANYAYIRDYVGFGVELEGSPETVDATVHDPYAGFEARWNQLRSRALIGAGWRAAVADRTGDTARSDSHVDVDLAHALTDRVSVELSGAHLERGLLEPVFPGFDYVEHREGTWTAGLHWSPFLKASLVYGYTTEQLQPRTHYFAGALEVRPHHRAVFRAFAGLRRGGLFCISGVCRNLPPFEGVQVTATLRY